MITFSRTYRRPFRKTEQGGTLLREIARVFTCFDDFWENFCERCDRIVVEMLRKLLKKVAGVAERFRLLAKLP